VTTDQYITFGGTGKGAHFPTFCAKCKGGERHMHTVTMMPPKTMESTPHKLPWLEEIKETEIGDIRTFGELDGMIYRDDELEDNL